ncbi:hypothetical protein [Bacillus velezensis]|uniref:hypothetical protein n=1 Tax=Bacillus velezensis TaxID=492670 RepID=UPI00083DB084|nr:hypothetical protein [Bacillus velezensis]ODB74170.1 hypothetical protein A7310_18110 [Bacillus velezensis]PAE74497.1 hypothetical protein CHH82_19550 [Bacillus velezensis]
MKNLRDAYYELLNKQIVLLQIEEILRTNGEFVEAFAIRDEVDNLYNQREAIKRRMDLKVVNAS